MEPTPDGGKKWQIYSIIIIGSVGLIWMFWLIVKNWNTSPSSDEIVSLPTNEIIESKSSLPVICQDTIVTMDCLLSKLPDTEDHQSLNLYYQKTISERNILDNKQLEKACTSQKKYLQNLEWTYKDLIKLCDSSTQK